jgi:RNA polymerase sigma factor (sigma-70 family)
MRIALETTISRQARPSAASVSSRYSPLAPVLQTGPRLPALDPSPGTTLCDQLLDEAALIERVNRGDEDAARSLAETLRPTILKCIRRPLPRWASEEDLVQIVFAKVFGKLRQFSGAVPLRHWVSRIAVNASLSQLAYESVRPELRMSDLSEEQEAVLQNISALPGDSEERAYAREVLDLLLAQLKPEEKMIIVLLHIEQRTTHEISRMTGLSVSSIKVKAFRTRHKMQRLGKRLLREGGHTPVLRSR